MRPGGGVANSLTPLPGFPDDHRSSRFPHGAVSGLHGFLALAEAEVSKPGRITRSDE
ncbi:hypothetical protein [Devriesea agamarum]|uniref:hypothetical protein n=1 Tax=Devriesea agamarum TaxID=472569 RepID=UPI0012ECE4D3|nr:hypothetical protein [Devriesea agamarum]